MNDIFKDAPISISIIDYLGQIENGVGLLLSMVMGNSSYEIGYWFNTEGQFRIVVEPKLLEKLEIEDIYQYEYINEFIYFIHNSLPSTDKILEEFIK